MRAAAIRIRLFTLPPSLLISCGEGSDCSVATESFLLLDRPSGEDEVTGSHDSVCWEHD